MKILLYNFEAAMEMPVGAKILEIKRHENGMLVMVVLANPEYKMAKRNFVVLNVNSPVAPNYTYVGNFGDIYIFELPGKKEAK